MASYSFFALPEEQYSWLRQYFDPTKVWCVVRDQTRDRKRWWSVKDPSELETFAYQAPQSHSVRVLIGRHDLSPPQWKRVQPREESEYADIEFFRSQCIDIDISLYSSKDASLLFEGSIGVAWRKSYRYEGVDPEPLYRWFHQFKRQWWKMMDRNFTPVYWGTAVRYEIPYLYSAAVSYEVVKRCTLGSLRLTVGSHVYDIVPTEKAREYQQARRRLQPPEGAVWCRCCRGSGEIYLLRDHTIHRCIACDGSGYVREDFGWCVRCEGSGSVWVPTESGGLMSQDCPDCGGLGFVP
jgi:hypothetical protein